MQVTNPAWHDKLPYGITGELIAMSGIVFADGYITDSFGELVPYAICHGERMPYCWQSADHCLHVYMHDE